MDREDFGNWKVSVNAPTGNPWSVEGTNSADQDEVDPEYVPSVSNPRISVSAAEDAVSQSLSNVSPRSDDSGDNLFTADLFSQFNFITSDAETGSIDPTFWNETNPSMYDEWNLCSLSGTESDST